MQDYKIELKIYNNHFYPDLRRIKEIRDIPNYKRLRIELIDMALLSAESAAHI